MKAKSVHESENFTRGGNPYKKMNLGRYDENYDWLKPRNEDRIELQEDIYDTQYLDGDVLIFNGETLTTVKKIMEGLLIKFEKGTVFEFDFEEFEWHDTEDGDSLGHHWIAEKNKEIFKKIR